MALSVAPIDFREVGAGVGIGLLVGLIVGVSASPVVSIILGSLAAGLVTFLGFKDETTDSPPGTEKTSHALRAGSFGIACFLAILLGIFIRTHDLLSPSIKQQVNYLVSAGFEPEIAKRVVLYRTVGLFISNSPLQIASVGKQADTHGSFLMAANLGASCSILSAEYANSDEQLKAIAIAGYPAMKRLAETLKSKSEPERKEIIGIVQEFVCAQQS